MLVGYARVSTQEQHPDLQINALKSAGCEKIFVETASGAQRDRPELNAALKYMRTGDTFIVWKLDRLARSTKQLIETVERLESQGVHFKYLTESIDTNTPTGRLVFHIFAALAEFERSIIRERTRAGLESAKARGRLGGRPRVMEQQGVLLARTMLLRHPEITVQEIAQRFRVSLSTLYRHIPGGRSGVTSGE